MESRACPVCGGLEAKQLFANRMLVIDAFNMSYDVGRCRGCGFHFANRLPPARQYGAYYQAASKYDVASAVSALDGRRIEAAVALMAQWIPKSNCVIDLGCGYGALLAAMRDAGWRWLKGVDPAPQSALRAHELFGLEDIRCGTVENAHNCVNMQEADLVCLMAVLEHLPNLRADLERLLLPLRPGAKLLIEVPVVEGFRADSGEPFGEFSIEHIQYFSFASLRNLLSSLGMRVIAEQWTDLPLIASGSAFVLAELVPGGSTPLREPEPSKLFDDYVRISESRLRGALLRVPKGAFIVYGAGSHSARLIPRLPAAVRDNVVCVVDGNPNLIGKRFGHWLVQAPDTIAKMGRFPILISSYRSQSEIASSLRRKYQNPLALLY